jgi:hypothetical protein
MKPANTRRGWFVAAFFLFFAALLMSACSSGSSSASGQASPTSVNATPTIAATSTPTITLTPTATVSAAVAALIKKMTFVGTTTARIVSGTTFEADGKITNGDNKQHDIYVQITLLDSAGKQVGTSTINVDNVKGNTTASFAIKGTAQQPTWSTVQATVVKVTENINGSGDD